MDRTKEKMDSKRCYNDNRTSYSVLNELSGFDKEFIRTLDITKTKQKEFWKFREKYLIKTKTKLDQEEVEPLLTPVLLENKAHSNLRQCAEKLLTVRMSKYYRPIILKHVQVPELEVKYPDVLEEILDEAEEEYYRVTHEVGVNSKIKPEDGSEGHITLAPYKLPGRTDRYMYYIMNKRNVQNSLYITHPLTREILQICVENVPDSLINFKQFRTAFATTIDHLKELFNDEQIQCRYFVRMFYKSVITLVQNENLHSLRDEEIPICLRACTGLLSIYLSRTIVNTINDLVAATASDDLVPYLNLTIGIDKNSRLILDPNPNLLVELYQDALEKISVLADNLLVLEFYKCKGYEKVYVPLFIHPDFVKASLQAVNKNLIHKFQPVMEYIDRLESEFFEVYGVHTSSTETVANDMSFDAGCEHVAYYREYLTRMTEKVSNEYFSIGRLQQEDCILSLKNSVEELMNDIFERLCEIHIYKNEDICERFKMLSVRALQVPRTSEALMEMGEYMLWANTKLLPALREDVTESLKMMTTLMGMSSMTKEHIALNTETVQWVTNIKPILAANATMYEQLKFKFEERLQKVVDKVNHGIQHLKPYLVTLDDMNDSENAREYLGMLNKMLVEIRTIDKRIAWINREEKTFKFPPSKYPDVDVLKGYITPFYHLIKIAFNWNRYRRAWLDGPFEFLNFTFAEEQIDDMFKELTKTRKVYKTKLRQMQAQNEAIRFKGSVDDPEFINLPAPIQLCEKVIQQIKDFRPALNLMGIMCCDSLLTRHWEEMCEVAGFDITPDAGTTLNKMMQMGLEPDIDKYEVISTAAVKERQLLENLLKMQSEWEDLKFKTSVYKETGLSIITQLDDIQAILDDHIIKTLSMRGSIFVKPYEDRVKAWYEKITRVNDTIDEWGKVQAQWLYLLPIFSSKDIVAQMPEEGILFREVNNTYTRYMKVVDRDPRVLETAGAVGLLENMKNCTKMLEKINEGVVNYLEKKRLFFPRFFFLSNDEMLEILSETKDPLRVQPHLRKCFEAINKLHFDEKLQIHAMLSQENERIDFLRVISTEDAKGGVEKWLVQVEEQMVDSIRHQIHKSWSNYREIARTKWVQQWPGQVVIAVSQVYWTFNVTEALNSGDESTVQEYMDELKDNLQDIVALIRSPKLTNLARITIKALIVIDVHAKDVVQELIDNKVKNDKEFKWLAQLRYYFTGECLVCIINATVKYAYEYLGNTDRLVITPLTDRCYRTLIGAYHLHLNGAPEGPAGTGKTETTKDLAKAIAVQCVVFNCSDGLDYKAMGKFFKGLASSGAWVCFDEFNRIEIEVLSVVAQQILSIVLAVRAHLKKFLFEGTELLLNPTCYVCITMNPGYAGRTELPDNLKVLFRTVAMMVPDYAMIGEISLYSYGFIDARKLSIKIVTTYRLCSEQLSSQNHYDYGMRAVKSVLSACGNNKRSFPDENEDILLLRSLTDVNLPKFLNHDVPLFEGIISDLFPGIILPQPDYVVFLNAAKMSCKKRNLLPKDSFLTKVIQTYEMMIVRHGFMIVGGPLAGKTSTLKILADTLSHLNAQGQPQEKVQYTIINPKSITIGQLYGQFDPVSYEWYDGVVATCFRNFVNDLCSDRKWIIFDGPVDAVWIENMNSALDDNKKLCLMSGEVMAMTNEMSLIFEVMDLAQASPATVSRCGMIYMEPATLGWKPFVQAWLPTCPPEWAKEHKKYILALFDWAIPPSLEFMRKNCRMLCNPGDISLVRSTMNILEITLNKAVSSIKKEEELQFLPCWIEATFITAGVWGLGGILDADSRVRFNEFYRNLWKGLDERYPFPENFEKSDLIIPSDGLLIDYFYHYRKKGTWKYWPDISDALKVEDANNIQQVLVPTVETQKYMSMVQTHIQNKLPILLVGPTGTGKSFYMQDLLMNQMDQTFYTPAFITFTVKISANQTQELVISKLNKRKRGHYGPSKGKTAVIFIDDLNMPAKDTYGSQPPIELLRQYFDHKNWYDLKLTTPIFLYDLLFVAAMGEVGGSRQDVYARFLRHFTVFSINEFSTESMSKIYTNILLLGYKNNGFPSEIITSVSQIVHATLDMYHAATLNLRPTPAKSHYVFNLRDFSRIIFGCAMFRKESADDKKNVFAKLWVHEILRVFYDRLITPEDKNWVYEKLRTSVREHFREHFDIVFDNLEKNEDGKITEVALKNLMFGTYMDPDASEEDARYEEILSLDAFADIANSCLEEYNPTHKNKMDVVPFKYALEHLSKVCRVLAMPCGSALLVGISGSGRQSLTKLASAMTGYQLFQPEITKNYTINDWRDDLKKIMKESGGRGRNCVFLFTEGQIKEEAYLQDIDCLLNSGEVPNIFQIDERQEILEMVRLAAQGGNKKIDISALAVYSYFIKRTREKLHIILCFSPIGSTFRNRLRLYPSLINCCTIDWFEDWPEDALEMVAKNWIADVNIAEEVKKGAIIACKRFHVDARRISDEFFNATSRKSYITSASYLGLIRSFTVLTNSKQEDIRKAKQRYFVGLEKLQFAAAQIAEMQKSLEELQPQLLAMSNKAAEVTRQIETETQEVEHMSNLVKADEKVANVQAAAAQALKAECEAELALAIPILEDAISALNTLKPADITLVKSMKNPPDAIKLVMAAVCVIKDVKPDRIPDPSTGRRILDYWGPSKRVLGEMNFLQQLKDFDKDHIKPEIMVKIRKEYLPHKDFKPHIVAKASSAAEGLCKWIIAMDMYDKVAKEVAPKKAKLEIAEREFAATNAILQEKKDLVASLEARLEDLTKNLIEATTKEKELQDSVTLCTNKLRRAQQLIGGLGGERSRWISVTDDLQSQYDTLAGDLLVSCGIIAYLAPFTAPYRTKVIAAWFEYVKQLNIPSCDAYSFDKILGSEVTIQFWCISGLPNDAFSIENAIIQQNSRRWSLLIDPQSQANLWIKKMEKKNELRVTKFIYADYMKTLEHCVENGIPALLENVEEDLEAPLDPLLFKTTFKQGGNEYISLGENVLPFHPDFKLYITTKLRNPHYLPEVFNKVTIVNFALTLEGLEDQLLGIVVARERPDLQKKRDNLIQDSADNKAALLQCEENILRTLSESQGDILEDESAIEILNESKTLSANIRSKQIIAVETEKKIEIFRLAYNPVAQHSAVLYYCIADLPNVDPMYQYSLAWFINLYINSIETAGKSRDIDKRIEFLNDAFTLNLYQNICRSLFEKDKLMFSFVLCTKMLIAKGKLTQREFMFLLTGGMATENKLPNPTTWLNSKSWDEICRVEELKEFEGFRRSFEINVSAWRDYYDVDEPQNIRVPEPWESKLNEFQRIIVMKLVRPDKLEVVIAKYIKRKLGKEFIEPPPFDIAKSFAESSALCPLIFILSPGTDPMSTLVNFADSKGFRLSSISLGQGQGPIAQSLIQQGQETGSWVCLQNCHLASSWMASLEKIWEGMDTANTHIHFRLWLTSYPSDKFPISILQYGIKMTNEPPTGLKSNLLRSFINEPVKNPDFFGGCGKNSRMFTRLLYGLAFFHAVVQERRTFGPLGWNIPYGFNESDFEISVNQLQMFINENEEEPEGSYEAVTYLTGECNYGGRVTDDWDRRLIVTILADFINPLVATRSNYRLATISNHYELPRKDDYDDYVEYINNLPAVHPPEVFGLHKNAGITRDLQNSEKLLDSMIKVQGEGSATAGGETDRVLVTLCTDILEKLPDPFDLEAAVLKYPVQYEESMNTVLVQEMERFNRLLHEIQTSLENVVKGIKGIIVMSPALEVLSNSLILGRIPEAWAKVSYPSMKTLPNYISDFVDRMDFLYEWFLDGKPENFWLSGFFFTQAFLTGAKQNYARKYTIPIDQLTFDFEVLKTLSLDSVPEDGVYVYGLFTDGARWDRRKSILRELEPKVLHDVMPLIWVIPINVSDYKEGTRYKCPVYKTAERRGVLSTTGHSTNYVLPILLGTEDPPAHWIKRSVALLCQLN